MFPQELKERGENFQQKWCELQSGNVDKLSWSLTTNVSLAGTEDTHYHYLPLLPDISFYSHVPRKKILRIFILSCVWVGLLEPSSRKSMEKDIVPSSNKNQRKLTHPSFLPSAAELCSCVWYKGKDCRCLLLPMLHNHPTLQGDQAKSARSFLAQGSVSTT